MAKRYGDIVEEMTGPADRPPRQTDDADEIESKYGVIFVFLARRL
jgi:hypothetical protein